MRPPRANRPEQEDLDISDCLAGTLGEALSNARQHRLERTAGWLSDDGVKRP